MRQTQRLLSLDTLRGFDMFFIMGLAPLIVSVCSLFPGGDECFLAQTMHHAKWNGLTHHDTIFPLFLFLAGVSFPFSLSRQLESGTPRKRIYLRIIRRALTLFCLGMVYNGLFNLELSSLRIYSVLGRIGLAWMLAAILTINFGVRTRAAICAVILVGYYLLVSFVPAPDVIGADPLSKEGNIVGYIDRLIAPAHIYYSGCFDPEGLLSTLPAVVTAMMGVFAGEFVRRRDISGGRKSLLMACCAVAFLIAGLVWSRWFPVNKMLWTSSFVLVVGAYCLGMFALFYYVIDVRQWRRWTFVFRVVGLNSITVYMAQAIFRFNSVSGFFLGGLAGKLPEEWGAVLLDAGYITVCWLFLYFLYRKGTFLKI